MTLRAGSVEADDRAYSMRLGVGLADENDLGEIMLGQWQPYAKETSVLNFDGGWRFVENAGNQPFDWYLKGGLSYFDENGYADNFWEGTLYVKVYWKIDFLKNRVRLGFGEGISYAQNIPIVEVDDATNDDGTVDQTQHLLNYLDISADIDVGRLLHVESLEDLYLGYTLKHRSGVFGLYNGVHGGSNYNMVTIEKNF